MTITYHKVVLLQLINIVNNQKGLQLYHDFSLEYTNTRNKRQITTLVDSPTDCCSRHTSSM